MNDADVIQVEGKKTQSTKVKQLLFKIGPLLALFLISLTLTLTTDKFLQYDNIMNIMKQTSVNGLVSAGMLIILITGGIDLAVGSTLAFSISLMGVTLRNGYDNVLLLVIICLAGGTFIGWLNGIALTKLRLPHPFISTLGMQNIARGVALFITAAVPISGFPRTLQYPGSATINGFPVSFIIVIVIFAVFHVFLNHTVLGRKIYSVGGNKEAAALAGINVDRVLTIAYIISGFMAAFAGLILVGRTNSAFPLAGLNYELDAIASCIIGGASFFGGKGTIWGTLIGALTISVIRNGLNLLGAPSDLQMIAIGSVIILAVYTDVIRVGVEARSKRLAAAKE
ncbi:MAG: ABC transporter permease [Bacillota bacterium]|nr:ABC transporter permease [Bacillota bacterium]